MTISEQAKKRAAELANIVAAEKGNRQGWRSTDTGFDTLDALARFIQETSDKLKPIEHEYAKRGHSSDTWEMQTLQSLILPDDEPSLTQEILIWLGKWRDNVPPDAVAALQNIADNVQQLEITKAEP